MAEAFAFATDAFLQQLHAEAFERGIVTEPLGEWDPRPLL
jgi:hypothetical protein